MQVVFLCIVWDVDKVLMEDQTVQLLYHGVMVREGASDEKVGLMKDENIEVHEKIFKLGGYLCPKCGQAFKDRPLMKKHLLSHYYQIFFSVLPNSKPFPCPICGKLNRDRIVLARHYAFFHKKIFDMTELTPGDLPLGKGRWSKRFKENRLIKDGDEKVLDEVKVEKNKKEENYTFHKCHKCGLSFNDTVSNVRSASRQNAT